MLLECALSVANNASHLHRRSGDGQASLSFVQISNNLAPFTVLLVASTCVLKALQEKILHTPTQLVLLDRIVDLTVGLIVDLKEHTFIGTEEFAGRDTLTRLPPVGLVGFFLKCNLTTFFHLYLLIYSQTREKTTNKFFSSSANNIE